MTEKTRRIHTSEEDTVGFVLAISLLIGIFLVALSNIIIQLGRIFGQITAFTAYVDLLLRAFGFQALFSVILALWFRFSRRQLKMMAKCMLGFDIVLPLALMSYGYFLFSVMLNLLGKAVILPAALMNVLLFGLVIVLRKLFGSRVYEWIRIKYVPETASLEVAKEHLSSANACLEKGRFEEANQEFHAAALMFLRLEDWSKTAENYWMAAETLSKEPNPDFGFDISWLFALSASAHLLGGNLEKAEKALELGKQALKNGTIDRKAEEKVSLILEFLTATLSKNIPQVNASWQSLNRRMRKWSYPVTEETILLLERNLNLLKSAKTQET